MNEISELLVLYKFNTKLGVKTVAHAGISVWNAVTREIRNSRSVEVFQHNALSKIYQCDSEYNNKCL